MIVSSADGRLLRREPDGSLVTHADLGVPGWNDIVADGRGNIYLNRKASTRWPVRFQPGFVFQVAADGSVRQVADGIAFPNGMAVTADNSTLIVADSYDQLVGFDIGADGALSGRRVWAELGEGTPDGICADARTRTGTPMCCSPSGVCGSVRAARCCRPSGWTGVVSPAPWAAQAGEHCSSGAPVAVAGRRAGMVASGGLARFLAGQLGASCPGWP